MNSLLRPAFLALLSASVALVVVAPGVAESPRPAEPQAQETASISGTVKMKAPIPRRVKIAVQADPKCAAMHRDGLLSEEIVADPAGRLQWAFVYIKKGLEDRKFDVPKKPVTLDQRGCRFEPHVFGVMVGQELMVRNNDELMHIIHVQPTNNREFGFSQSKVGETRPKTFEKPEVMIRVFCDVHPWMRAWAGILTHPFHDATDAAGKFEIKGIPPGKYTIEVWHETLKSFEQEIELKGKESKTLNVELTDKK